MRNVAYTRQTVSGALTRRSCSLCVSYHNFFPASARPSKRKCLPLPTFCFFSFQNFGVPHLPSRLGLLRWFSGSRVRSGIVLLSTEVPLDPEEGSKLLSSTASRGRGESKELSPVSDSLPTAAVTLRHWGEAAVPTEPLCTLPPVAKHAKNISRESGRVRRYCDSCRVLFGLLNVWILHVYILTCSRRFCLYTAACMYVYNYVHDNELSMVEVFKVVQLLIYLQSLILNH